MYLRNGRMIGRGERPYIVAELNSSHNGDIDTAKKMVEAAKTCGCDAVKFQSWSANSLYCSDYYERNPIAKRMVSRFSLDRAALKELMEYCRGIDIDFSSTPYSRDEVDFLSDELQVPFIKVASMDINNLPYIRYIADKKVPIVLSTGMASLDEVALAVNAIEETGLEEICILHCVSLYPAANKTINLRNISTMEKLFKSHAIGYSDHTIGCAAATASVALGAALIEKHFTLDSKKVGWDNQMATEPKEMEELVKCCMDAYTALGSSERIISDEEMAQQKKMRRSLVARCDLSKGSVLREEHLDAKRPGDGISVDRYKEVVGCILNRDVKKDRMIMPEYLLSKDVQVI